MNAIRSLFSEARRIDRPIEKVIDYARNSDDALAYEIAEYEVTEQVEENFIKFLEIFRDGVSGSNVTQTGVWVSGFYGSGKSSFSKYLGLALDHNRVVNGKPFRELLASRLHTAQAKSLLAGTAETYQTATVFLDLGSEMIANAATATPANVLYLNVLQWAGYSKDPKLAELERHLDEEGKLDDFKEAYERQFPGKGGWDKIHHNPLLGIARADKLVSQILPEDYAEPGAFSKQHWTAQDSVEEIAERMIGLVRRKTDCQHVLFVIDEAGQYVAARSELILNLDGLARAIKAKGQGKAWIIATGQQTLNEVVERAMYNSDQLGKLKDRFPVDIHLKPEDIKVITHRRLLTKSTDGRSNLQTLWDTHGARTKEYTKITEWRHNVDLTNEGFLDFYPLLPQHFEILLRLIRGLARTTGGIGLRSAIRVVQDLLVDVNHVLPQDMTPIAERPVGELACIDDFFDTMRADIQRQFGFIVDAVARIQQMYKSSPLHQRIGKAIGILQILEDFPRSDSNIAALLYRSMGDRTLQEEVKDALQELTENKESSVVFDPQSQGYIFLSEGVRPLQEKRNGYIPSSAEVNAERSKLIREAICSPTPSIMLEDAKRVDAGVLWQKSLIAGDRGDITLRIEPCDSANRDDLRKDYQASTGADSGELRATIICLVDLPTSVSDAIHEAVRSTYIIGSTNTEVADKDVAKYIRSERKRLGDSLDRAKAEIEKAFASNGELIARGIATPIGQEAETFEASVRKVLQRLAEQHFSKYRLAAINPKTDLAEKFLSVDRLDRMTTERDPLKLVAKVSGRHQVDMSKEVLTAALQDIKDTCDKQGGRIHGHIAVDLFEKNPYGWSKDASRYIIAALFRAGVIKLHTPDGVITTVGPKAIEAFKSNQSFRRIGLSMRDDQPSLDDLHLAASRLELISGGQEVMPLEEDVAEAVRKYIPVLQEDIAGLPEQLSILELPDSAIKRARNLAAICTDLLKEDASHAYQLLAGKECTVPDDATWARQVARTLGDGGVETIKEARALKAEIDRISSLMPDAVAEVLTEDDAATIDEFMASDAFHERIPQLATTMQAIRGRAVDRYAELAAKLGDAGNSTGELGAARDRIEKHENWGKITVDDQKEIRETLIELKLPEATTAGQALRDIEKAAYRRGSLASVIEKLSAEIDKRVPEEKPQVDDGGDEGGEKEGRSPTPIKLTDLPSPSSAVLNSSEDIEEWLSSLRETLEEMLAQSEQRGITVIKP